MRSPEVTFCKICKDPMIGTAQRKAAKLGGMPGVCGGCRKEIRVKKKWELDSLGCLKCSRCAQFKPLDQYPKDIRKPFGVESSCKKCRPNRKSNPSPGWYKKYREKHKEKISKYRSEYNRNVRKIKRAADPKYKVNNAVSSAMRNSLKNSKSGRSWESLVGYSAEKLIRHLGKKLQHGMTWENYGSYWHIDHIIPLSALNFEKPEDIDFKRAWALKNLRPLTKVENLSKGSRPLFPVQRSFVFPLRECKGTSRP